jgi:hypothetical protein
MWKTIPTAVLGVMSLVLSLGLEPLSRSVDDLVD